MILLFLLLFTGSVLSYPIPSVEREFLWPGKPFPYAHVCTISELSNGEFVAAYQAGSGERREDCAIYRSIRSVDGKWSEPTKVFSLPHCQMNPSLYQTDDGLLFLMYHYNGGLGGRCNTRRWKGYFATSHDNGRTFQNNTELPKGFLGSVKNNCIKLSNGDVMCPSSTEVEDEVLPIWSSHFEFTNDQFSKWEKTSSIHFHHGARPCEGIIQPTIVEYATGKVRAVFRSSCGVLATAVSEDDGRSWPYWAEATTIPNPGLGGAGVDMTRMDKSLGSILVYNNSTKDRTPLSLAYTLDGGENWHHLMDLETDRGGIFEYPYVIQSRFDPDKAYVCYTYRDSEVVTMAFSELNFGQSQKHHKHKEEVGSN